MNYGVEYNTKNLVVWNMINGNTKLTCLIGKDVRKSLSPAIHNYVYEKLNINARYLNFSIEESEIEDFIKSVKILKIPGFNVTVPYKESIIKYLDEIDETAKNIGAVNTVKNNGGKLIGYNTDGEGFLKSLIENNVKIENKKILILGAGGAARGISFFLCKRNPKLISIKNRNLERARKLKADLSCLYSNILFQEYNDKEKYDLIINTTTVGMNDPIASPYKLSEFDDCVIADIVYTPRITKFLKQGLDLGIKTVEGIEMLIYQGIIADEIWFDRSIESKDLLIEIMKLLQKNSKNSEK